MIKLKAQTNYKLATNWLLPYFNVTRSSEWEVGEERYGLGGCMVFTGGMVEDHLRAPADLGQTDAVRGVQKRQIVPDCRVEHSQ